MSDLAATPPAVSDLLAARARRVARVAALVGASIAVGSLAGFVLGSGYLRSALLDGPAMKASTAAALIALALSVLAIGGDRSRLGRVLGVLVVALGAITVAQHALGGDLGLGTPLTTGDEDGIRPNTAVALILGGAASALHGESIGRWHPSNLLALSAALIGLVAAVGYAAGLDSLTTVGPYTAMALPTALALICLGSALLLVRTVGATTLLVSPTLGGELARRLLPVACLLPTALAYLRWHGQELGLYGNNVGIMLFAGATIFITAGSVWGASRLLDGRETARRAAEEARHEAEALFESAFEEAPIGMAIADLDGRYRMVNEAFSELTGYAGEELCQMSFASITHPDDLENDREGLRAMLAGEIGTYATEKRYVHASGHAVWASLKVVVVRNARGRPERLLTQVEDITDRREYERKLHYMADYDPLTGLLNRRSFERELDNHVARGERYGADGALLVLDVDHFKCVNDTLGHSAGDAVIAEVGRVVTASVRESDVVARLGGDEFAVLLPHADAPAAELVAQKLCESTRSIGLTTGGRPLSLSVGVAPMGDVEGLTGEDLLVNADLAMYTAKEAGRDGWALYASDDHERARLKGRLTWVNRIRSALDEDRFTLLAQPIVDLSTGRPTQHELLLRLQDETGDLVPPGAFLYIAEQLDLVQEIDRWVAGRAIALLAEREAQGRPICIEINLSGRSLGDPALLEIIETGLRSTAIDPSNLILEVTETAAVANIVHAREFAERLSSLGCRFALDDFGAGFGSFYYLKHLPFDLLKIDGEFVRHCLTTRTDRLVISAVVDIARGLGKQTVAEFVGDDETSRLLTRLGVDFGQGYHLGRPVALDAIPDGLVSAGSPEAGGAGSDPRALTDAPPSSGTGAR